MRRSRERLHHGKTRVARYLLASGVSVAMAAILPWPESSAQAATRVRIHLPTVADGIAFAPNSQTILFGSGGIETKVPGPVQDAEAVSVGLDVDGAPVSVRVAQRLTVSGVGDFEIRVPGPAQRVRPLPGSAEIPGLRKGAVLWQGFSPGRKVLAAAMDLFPDQESARLPLRFRLSMTVNGQPLRAGHPATGALDVSLSIANVSAIPIQVDDARAAPAALAPVLDVVRGRLLQGRRPQPGHEGVPTEVNAAGPVQRVNRQIEAPFRITGELVFAPGTVEGARVSGGRLAADATGIHVRFSRQVGGGFPLQLALRLGGRATALSLPSLSVDASRALPSPDLLRPPAGATWRDAVGRGAALDGTSMLGKLLTVMWQTARIKQYEQYVGNPDPLGPSTTTYAFILAPPAALPSTLRLPPRQIRLLGVMALAIAALIVALAAAVAWAHS